MFDLIRHENPKILNKIKAFDGNVSSVNFGLNDNDFDELLNDVSIVIHAAATVRFNEPLKLAVEMNVLPVIKLIEMCQMMKNLEVDSARNFGIAFDELFAFPIDSHPYIDRLCQLRHGRRARVRLSAVDRSVQGRRYRAMSR